MAWLVVAGLATLAAVSIRYLPAFHPAQLWALPWLVVCALYALHLIPYNPLRAETAAVIFGAACAFCVTAWLSGGRAKHRSSPAVGVPTEHLAPARTAAWLLLLVTGVWLGAFLLQSVAAYGAHATLVTSMDVRYGVQTGQFVLTIKFVYAALAASMATALVAALALDRRTRRRWLLITTLPILSMYFSTGRSNLVTALMMAVLTYVVAKPVAPRARQAVLGLVAVGVIFVVTLTVGGNIIGKTYEASALSRIDSTFSHHRLLKPVALPYQYATAPIAALNELIPTVGPDGATGGCATVPFACTVGQRVGATGSPVPSIRVFTAEPLEWNTYTALDAPVLDAGPAMSIIIVAALGALVGLAWAMARRGKPVMVALYGVVGTATISSVIQNNFFAFHYIGAILLFAVAWLVALQLRSRGPAIADTKIPPRMRPRGRRFMPRGLRL